MSKMDLRKDVEKRIKSKVGRKHKRDAKLQELEKQLQFAESRCGTLKQQLDYIKLLYGCGECPDISVQTSFDTGCGGGDNFDYHEGIIGWKKPEECSAGKEEGVRPPEFSNQKDSRSNSTFTNSSKQNSKKENKMTAVKNHGKIHQKLKRKNGRKLKKRRQAGEEFSSSKFSSVSSQTRSQIWQDPVVEIYKNGAANAESESGLDVFASNKKKNRMDTTEESRKVGQRRGNDPSAAANKSEETMAKKSNNAGKESAKPSREEAIQTDAIAENGATLTKADVDFAKNFAANKDQVSSKPEPNFFEPIKSYCQPTISSKRKQVERDVYSSLNNLNVRSIPFIVARSTAPSHNIGVNIQQVLSIIKKRHHLPAENSANSSNDSNAGANEKNNLVNFLRNAKKAGSNDVECVSEESGVPTGSSESKKRSDNVCRSSMSYWMSSCSGFLKDKRRRTTEKNHHGGTEEGSGWTLKVDRLKKVLVLLHEDFTSLSQKYKRLQRKLTKRNITKADAKEELREIEKDLEKKEEEIIVIIGLYKEVLTLKEDMKKLQDKYDMLSCAGKSFALDGLKQSNSAHTQMTALLRKIQNFQDQLQR